MAIASAVAAISLDYGAFPAILAALIVVTLIGAFSGWLISTFKIQPIIVTLALLIAGRGVANLGASREAQMLAIRMGSEVRARRDAGPAGAREPTAAL